jgi:hypothetical protein
MFGMDRNDNDQGLTQVQKVHSGILDLIFLPLPLAFLVIGLGILTGLIFKENLLLQGAMKWIIGLAFIAYGSVRSAMIILKYRRKRKDLWIEKS